MRKRRTRPLRLISLVFLFAFPLLPFIWVAALWFYQTPTDCAIKPRFTMAPQEAKNLQYVVTYQFTAFEFNIDENGFRKWSKWPLQEITEPQKIRRYTWLKTPQPLQTSNRETLSQQQFEELTTATIRNGLFYHYVNTSGTGGCHVVFDRLESKAYFQSNPI